ncbi:MAG: DUF1127 domain-containing protein [Reyranellaceae bacterium]
MSSTMMHTSPTRSGAVARGAGKLPVRHAVLGALTWWFDMRAKQRSRRQLAELDPRLLRDIGIDRASAAEEARRSMWH